MGMEEKHALNLAKPEKRAALVTAILKAKEQDKAAAG
jgi:hypothetical protein